MLIDTSVIIQLLTQSRGSVISTRLRRSLGDEEIVVSILELAELSDWCLQNKSPVSERIEAVKKFASLIPLDEETCREGSKIKHGRRALGYKDFGIIDGMILATARRLDEKLLTFDPHFEGEPDCIILDPKTGLTRS
jgi:predicted nucleic acid-binding protein